MVDIMSKSYSNNPLSEVLIKLQFATIKNIEQKMDSFYEKIKNELPFKGVKSNPKISINIKNEQGSIKTDYEPSSWYFHKTENVSESPIVIEVTKNSVLLDFNANIGEYSCFEEFKEKYISLLSNALSVLNIESINSIGLRYINNINCSEGNPIKWGGLISEDLLLDSLLNKYDSPSRAMTDFFFEKNGFLVNFKFGIFNTEFPNPIARKEFILDFDCIWSNDMDSFNIEKITEKMHDTISELFEESLTEKYKEYMDSEPYEI